MYCACLADELQGLMSKTRRKQVSMEEAAALCAKVDGNGDRVIEWEELKVFMTQFLHENRKGRGSTL